MACVSILGNKRGFDVEGHDSMPMEQTPVHNICESIGSQEKKSKSKRDILCYDNLTPEQRQQIRNRQNERNALLRSNPGKSILQRRRANSNACYSKLTPDQKKAKIERGSALRILRRDTPSKDSIAMLNPMYIPSDVDKVVTSSIQDSTPSKDSSIACEGGLDQDLPDAEIHVNTANITRRRQRITPGQRNALLAIRNEMFATSRRSSNEESTNLDESVIESIIGEQPPLPADISNNGNGNAPLLL